MADDREAWKQSDKLELSQGKHFIFLFCRPFILGFFKAFIPKRKACFIPVQHFDFVTLFVVEQEQCATSQGEIVVTFDNRREAIDGLPKVDTLTIRINL